MAEKTGRNTWTVLLVRCAALVVSLCCLTLPSRGEAQDAEVGEPVQPAPEIRLTGVLAAVQEPAPSAFPVLSLWIDGTRWRLQVRKVESITHLTQFEAQELNSRANEQRIARPVY
jgi:hypothetical protein